MSRSEFFSRAARRYIDDLDRTSLTANIDHAIGRIGHDESSQCVVAAGRRRLQDDDDAW